MSSAFALEIYEKIIDELGDSPSALKSTSLVCKAWLPRSRYHLFHRLRLRSQVVWAPASPLHDTRNRIVELFSGGNLASQIPGLFLDHTPLPDAARRNQDPSQDATLVAVPLKSLLELSDFRLTALRFLRVSWSAFPEGSDLGLLYRLVQVTSLLEKFIFENYHNSKTCSVSSKEFLTRILGGASNLKALGFKDVSFTVPVSIEEFMRKTRGLVDGLGDVLDDIDPSEPPSSPSATFEINGFYLEGLRSVGWPDIDWNHIKVLAISAEHLQRILSVLQRKHADFGQSLKELTFTSLEYGLDICAYLASFDLPVLSSLHVLAGEAHGLPTFLTSLTQNNSLMPALRHLTLSITSYEDPLLAALESRRGGGLSLHSTISGLTIKLLEARKRLQPKFMVKLWFSTIKLDRDLNASHLSASCIPGPYHNLKDLLEISVEAEDRLKWWN